MGVACYNHCMQLGLTPQYGVTDPEDVRGEECITVNPEQDARDSEDAATRALDALVSELDHCIEELSRARTRAEVLLRARRSGRQWLEVVTREDRPLIVERISTVLAALATAGHAWRLEQAVALQREDVSINRIAALFGVTRQRISALLKESGNDDETAAETAT
jgi:hypothetical protein